LPLVHAREHAGDVFGLGDLELKTGDGHLAAQDRQGAVVGAAGKADFFGCSHSELDETV